MKTQPPMQVFKGSHNLLEQSRNSLSRSHFLCRHAMLLSVAWRDKNCCEGDKSRKAYCSFRATEHTFLLINDRFKPVRF